MGFLSSVSGGDHSSKAVSPEPSKGRSSTAPLGLLKKSQLLSISDGKEDFFLCTLLKKYKFMAAGILEKVSPANFCLTESIGLDGKSVLKSLSTEVFWTGTIPRKEEWIKIARSSLDFQSFCQFFSEELIERIKTLLLYFTDDNRIFMICLDGEDTRSIDENLAQKLKSLLSYSARLPETNEPGKIWHIFRLSIEEIIATMLIQNKIGEFEDELGAALMSMISNRFSLYFTGQNFFISSDKLNYTLFLYSDSNFPDSLFYEQFQKELAKIINENSELISIKKLGTANDAIRLRQFIQAE